VYVCFDESKCVRGLIVLSVRVRIVCWCVCFDEICRMGDLIYILCVCLCVCVCLSVLIGITALLVRAVVVYLMTVKYSVPL
jgi:hypothetical protein